MKEVKVLGSGCSKCTVTARAIEEVAREKGVEIHLEKVTDHARIASYGVMGTPGVVIDGRVVHSGSVPARASIVEWL